MDDSAKRHRCILMVASSYPRNDQDSAAEFLRNLAQSVAAHECEVHVLAPWDRAVSPARTGNVTIHHFYYFLPMRHMLAYGSGVLPNLRRRPWLLIQAPFFIVSMFIALVVVSLKVKPNVIHAHWVIPVGLVAVIAGRFLRAPVVTTAHGGDAFGLNGYVWRKLKMFTLNRCVWTANTRSTARALMAPGCTVEPAIIPMGVDCDRFKCDGVSTAVSNRGDRFKILFVGRLVEKKGVDILINAFAVLCGQTGRELELWILGDGDQRERLEALAERLGVRDLVRFEGRMSNHELPGYYCAADLFVAPSIVSQGGDTEGQGVVLIEAMACAKPVIASNVGGIPDVIQDKQTGWLVEPSNVQKLADKMRECISHEDLEAMSRRARNAAETYYDWPIIAAAFINLYKQTIADSRRS